MPTAGLRLGRVAGVDVRLAPSWFVIAALVTLLYANRVSLTTGPGLPAYLGAFAFAVLLAASVLVHEAAHAVVASAFGLHVDEIVVDLWGGHTSLGRPRTPLESAIVSVAAPLSNLVLAGVLWVSSAATAPGGLTGFLLSATALANLLVGLFNLLPGLPLDGGRVAEALVWAVARDRDRGTEVAGWLGRIIVVGAVALLVLVPFTQGRPPSLFSLVWAGLLGASLWGAASAAIRVARSRRLVRGIAIGPLTEPVTLLPAGATLAQWATVAPAGRGVVVLTRSDGRPDAVVDPAAAAAVPLGARPATAAASAAVRLPDGAWIGEGAGSLDAVETLSAVGGPGLLVLGASADPAQPRTPRGWVSATRLGEALAASGVPQGRRR